MRNTSKDQDLFSELDALCQETRKLAREEGFDSPEPKTIEEVDQELAETLARHAQLIREVESELD